jgi:hypothetical protein
MVYFLHLAIYLPKFTQPFQEHMPAPWMAYVWCMNGTCGKLSPPLDNFPVSSFPIHVPHLFALFPSNIPRKSAKLVAGPSENLRRPLRNEGFIRCGNWTRTWCRSPPGSTRPTSGYPMGYPMNASSFYRKRWENIEKFFCRWRFFMGFDGDILWE